MIVGVTGISSGLGRSLIPKLQKDPDIEKIVGIDIADYPGNSEKIEFHKIDIRDFEELKLVFKGVDVLIHLAFIVVPENMPKLRDIYDININGSIRVFKAASNYVKKIIHMSSVAAYGHLDEMSNLVYEDSPILGIKTKNFYYSHCKGLLEKYLDFFEKKFPDIILTRFRPPIISGENFFNNVKIFELLNKIKIISKNKRHNFTQLIHQDDLTDVIMIALKEDHSGAFNISSNPINFDAYLKKIFGNTRQFPVPQILLDLIIKLGKICKPLSRYTGWLQAAKNNGILITKKIQNEFGGWKPKYTTEDCFDEILNMP